MDLLKKIKIFTAGIVLAIVPTLTTIAHAQGSKPFGKIAGYYDTRGKPTATLTLGASDLPLGTKFFSFTDIESEEDNLNNLKKPYGEYRLSKKLDIGLGVAAEYNRDFSKPKGVSRIGFIFEPNLKNKLNNTFLGIKFYPAYTNDYGAQLGLYGNKSFRDGDIILDGFLDYNFKPKKIVTDLQLGKRIKDNLYGVIEGRYNGFMQEGEFGIGLGLEKKF